LRHWREADLPKSAGRCAIATLQTSTKAELSAHARAIARALAAEIAEFNGR